VQYSMMEEVSRHCVRLTGYDECEKWHHKGGVIMVEPKPQAVVLSERPHLVIPPSIRLFGPFVRPLVRLWLRLTWTYAEKKIRKYVTAANQCFNRHELESLLGEPEYVLAGSLYRHGTFVPDTVESYLKDGCRIEVCFLNGQMQYVIGSEDLSYWNCV